MNPDLQENEIENSVIMINSTHKSVQLEGLLALRKLISVNYNPPIQEVVDSGIVPKILEILASENETKFLIESSWCILNICSREEEKFTECIIELGGLDIIINLFDSQVEEIIIHAVWAMRNISGTGSEYRDMCLERDCVSKLLQILERFSTSQNLIDHTIHGLSNLCHLKPPPQWDLVLPALPVFCDHISKVRSQENLTRVLWAISCISEQNIQEVIDQGCVPFLIYHLCHESQELMPPTLRALGNLVAGEDFQANEVLDFPEFLPRILELTQNDSKFVQKEAFWVISNIAAGTEKQIEMIIEGDAYIERLKTAIETEHPQVAEEAAWAILNMFQSASFAQIQNIVSNHGLLKSFAPILMNLNATKQEALGAILNLLQRGEDCDCKKEIKEAGLVEIIKDMANCDQFSSNANLILEYFPETDQEGETKKKEENENNQVDSDREV